VPEERHDEAVLSALVELLGGVEVELRGGGRFGHRLLLVVGCLVNRTRTEPLLFPRGDDGCQPVASLDWPT
jgi:hypothetical protein